MSEGRRPLSKVLAIAGAALGVLALLAAFVVPTGAIYAGIASLLLGIVGLAYDPPNEFGNRILLIVGIAVSLVALLVVAMIVVFGS